MNPQLMALLSFMQDPKYKMPKWPRETQMALDTLMRSGHADTLRKIYGRRDLKVALPNETSGLSSDWSALYKPNVDSIYMSPTTVNLPYRPETLSRPERQEFTDMMSHDGESGYAYRDRALAHEVGHKMYENSKLPKWLVEALGMITTKGTNTHEVAAEAFDSANDYLRQTDVETPSRQQAMKHISRRDLESPGSAMLLNFLLQQKTYANHPLKQVLQSR